MVETSKYRFLLNVQFSKFSEGLNFKNVQHNLKIGGLNCLTYRTFNRDLSVLTYIHSESVVMYMLVLSIWSNYPDSIWIRVDGRYKIPSGGALQKDLEWLEHSVINHFTES